MGDLFRTTGLSLGLSKPSSPTKESHLDREVTCRVIIICVVHQQSASAKQDLEFSRRETLRSSVGRGRQAEAELASVVPDDNYDYDDDDDAEVQ